MSTKGDKRAERSLEVYNGTYVVIDPLSGAMLAVDMTEHMGHEGLHFYIKGVTYLDGANATAYFMFDTPITPNKYAHVNAIISSEAEYNLVIFEDSVVSASGFPVVNFNNDRNSAVVSELKAYAAPSITATGNKIWEAQTGTGKNSTGVSPALGYELIAKVDTTYLWQITKAAAGNHYVDYDFFWYEHIKHNI